MCYVNVVLMEARRLRGLSHSMSTEMSNKPMMGADDDEDHDD